MERKVGTISRGIRCPIIREGDNLADIVVTSVLEAAESEGFELRDRDVIACTESIVARAQGNYAKISRCYIPDFKQKPFCNLLKRYCHGRQKGSADALLSQ